MASSQCEGGLHPVAVAARFSEQVARAWEQGGFDALVLVGGDGAAAVLDRLGVEQIMINSAILPGTPDGRVVGGPAHGLRLVTKSGGFGGADALVTVVRLLRSDTLRRDAPGTVRYPPDHDRKKIP
jgi:uncharacterized protein YgbK (DUF1537 family)